MAEKVVVAGAGFTGLNSALKLSRQGYEVTLIDREGYHEYKPGIINMIRERLGEESIKLNLNDFLENTSVEFTRENILGFDPEEKVVETSSGAHNYDYLVLALGGEPATFGMDISPVETCYDLDSAESVFESLEDGEGEAIVIGAGYVGIEIAGEMAERGTDVTIVDGATRPVPNANDKCSDLVLDYLNRKDIAFRGGNRASDLSESSVTLENGKTLEADTVIWAGGVQASTVVQESFDVDHKGLPVNSGLASKEYDDIFAAGDCADAGSLKTAHNALNQANIIAANVPKGDGEALEEYDPGTNPLVISLGNTGIFHYGEKAYKNRLFRKFKDLVRWRYWFLLKRRGLFARF